MLNKLAASMVCDHTAEASPRLGNLCGCGGTGIHSGLKIRQMSYQHFEGSTPSTRTIKELMTKTELKFVKELLLRIKPQDEQVLKALSFIDKNLALYAAQRGQLKEMYEADYPRF